MASALPPSLRFVDYFFQTGLAPDTNLLERRVVDCEDDGVSSERHAGGSVVKEPASTISTPQIGTHVDTSYESVKFDMVELTPTTDSEPPSPFSAQAGSTITSSPPRKSFEGRTTVTSKASSQLDPATMTPCATKMKRRHPIEYRYQPDVLCRYPAEDYPDNGKFPQYLSMFCFPNDITLKYEPDGPPASTFHSFIITEESGSKNYGVCVTIYEKLHPNLFSQLEAAIEDWRTDCMAQSDLEYMQHIQSQLATNQETILRLNRGMVGDPRNPDADPADVLAEAEEKVALYKELLSPMKSMLVDVESIYVPRCLGLLSHWPWHDVFNDWLRELIKVVTGNYEDVETRALATYAPLERCLVNLFHEVPLPPPGRVELCINIGQMRLFCSRPPVNTVQVLQNFSLYPVFRTLSIQSIITLFELGLTEKKIIFLSSHCSMLTLACETLCLLLYPLSWQHILIPVLPSRLLSYLQAPMPYIIGVQREYFTRAQEEEWRPHDAALIDLDNNTIDVPMMLPTIPLRDRKKLQARLSKYAGNNGVSLASSTSPTSGIKEQMKGVPITVKYAYPNGVLVPFSNLSKRWINAEMELAARNSAAAAASHRHTKGHADRRASYESVHEKSAAPGTQTNSPASAVSFFTKFNKSVTGTLHTNNSSSESFTSSLDTLNASFIPVSATPLVSVHNESALTGPEEEETDQFDEDMLDRSRKAQIDQVRRRTRSATPEYGDPNTLPPLAPLVLSGDGPGHAYSGIPIKPDLDSGGESACELISPDSSISPSSPDKNRLSLFGGKDDVALNFASIFSFSPSTPQARSSTLPRKRVMGGMERAPNQPSDTWSISSRNVNNGRLSIYAGSTVSSTTTSPTYFQSNGNLQSVHGSQTSLNTSGDRLTDSRTAGISAKVVEGHSFVEILVDPLNREADIGDDAFGSHTGGTGPSSSYIPPTETPTPLPAKESARLGPSVGKGLLSGLRAKSGSREVISSVADLGSSSNVNVGGGRRLPGSTTLLKGDAMPKMPDHICRLCQLDLRSKEETSHILKCELCSFSIHTGCLPLVECHPCINFFNERKIQASFLKVFTSLLKSYRAHLIVPEQVKKAMAEDAMRRGSGELHLENGVANIVGMDLVQDDWFKKEEFLASQDKESRPFLSVLIETQSFAQFTLDRIERPESDYEILFFDESIKAKLNRSKLKFSKETTPFLKDSTYNIRATVAVATPNMDNLDPSKTFSTSIFPIALDKTLVVPGRPVAPLVTPTDQKMMRSHTIELVQRARMVSGMKRKQDFSKWMRTKLKHFQKIGGGEIVSLGHLSDEQRRELFEERLHEVAEVIDRYEAAHLSSLNIEEVRAAIDDLHAQHLILMRAADEEQLVDSSDQEELQTIYNRLFRVITIYEDHQGTIETPTIVSRDDDAGSTISGDPYTHPLVAIVGEVNKEIIERGVQRDMNPALRKLEKDSSMISLPSSVRSRSSSLRSYAGKKNVTLSAVIVPRDSATRPKDLLAKDSSRDPSSAGRGARGEGRTPSPLSASNSDPSPATASRSSPLSEPNSSVSAHAVESLCSSARNSIAPVRSVSITEALEHFPVPSEEPILGLGRLVAVTKATMPSMSSSSLKEALDAISENLDRAVATTVVTETGEKQNVQKPLLQGLEGIVTKTTVNVSIGANAESENLCTSAGASPEF